MKSINYLVLFVFALTITVSSCKKDELKSKKEILTSKSWKIASMKIDGVLQTMDDCNKDDILTFAANGTYSFDAGTLKCYDNDESYSGTWTLSDDGKTITLDGDLASIEITESKVVVTQELDGSTSEVTLIPK